MILTFYYTVLNAEAISRKGTGTQTNRESATTRDCVAGPVSVCKEQAMNVGSTKWRNQINPQSRRSFRVLISAAAAGNRAILAGIAARAVRSFGTLLLRSQNLLTRLRAWVSALLRFLVDKRHNELQKFVLLRFIPQNTASQSPSAPQKHRQTEETIVG